MIPDVLIGCVKLTSFHMIFFSD